MRLSKPHIISPRLLGIVLLTTLATSACNQSNSQKTEVSSPSGQPQTVQAENTSSIGDRQLVRDFADHVIIPTYQTFADRAADLATALNNFAQNPTAETLKAAQTAWVEARSPWEQSESFGFGPADSLGYDAALDTWPINETDIKKVLASSTPLTPEAIEKLQDSEKGFHVIEYLLFGNQKDKQLAQFTPREREYLQALGQDFSRVATALATSWKQGGEGQPAYREVIATAGESNNTTYPTLQAGTEEIVHGLIDSLNEVATEKLGKPLETKDAKLLESRFSFNTLTDIKHNVQGAQNVYLGNFPAAKTQGTSLSQAIAQINPQLDQTLKNQFETAMNALDKVSVPLETGITDPKATESIEAAQKAINTLYKTVEEEVLPLVEPKS